MADSKPHRRTSPFHPFTKFPPPLLFFFAFSIARVSVSSYLFRRNNFFVSCGIFHPLFHCGFSSCKSPETSFGRVPFFILLCVTSPNQIPPTQYKTVRKLIRTSRMVTHSLCLLLAINAIEVFRQLPSFTRDRGFNSKCHLALLLSLGNILW